MAFDIKKHSHRRWNPLTSEWILCSPHRTKRPWQGKEESAPVDNLPAYDPRCYLCPSNERAGGTHNPDYASTFSFVNDFAALTQDFDDGKYREGLLLAESEKGICKVICYSPRHDLTLAQMSQEGIEEVIRLWIEEYKEISLLDYVSYIQIFENKGDIMGCSNPHPHGQIWGTQKLPVEVHKKQVSQLHFYHKNKETLLSDYLLTERNLAERVIYENSSFVVLVPFWAIWPYETMIIPKEAMPRITDLSSSGIKDYADAMKIITGKYDRLFGVSFPYSSGIHQAPADGKDYPAWHWHHSYYPPLLRSATIKKFMVGFEMFGTPQRDFTPEYAAEVLRSV